MVDVQDAELEVEEALLKLGIRVYLEAKSAVLSESGSAESSVCKPLDLMKVVYPPAMFSEVCLLISWGAVETAKCFVEGVLRSPGTGIMLDPPYIMQGTGTDISWLVLGYPCILDSRVLGLNDKFRRAFRSHRVTRIELLLSGNYHQVVNSEKFIRLMYDTTSISVPTQMVLSWPSKNLRMIDYLQNKEIPLDRSQKKRNGLYNMYCTISDIVLELVTNFRSDNLEVHVTKGLLQLAVYIVRVLVSDVYRRLDIHSVPGGSARRTALEVALHRRKKIPFTSTKNVLKMTVLLEEGKEWPEIFRIDLRGNDPQRLFGTAAHRSSLKSLQGFYPGCRTLKSAIAEPDRFKKMYKTLNEDGSMKFSDFISKLYRSSEYLDHFTDILNKECKSTDKITKIIRARDRAVRHNQPQAIRKAEQEYIALSQDVFRNAHTDGVLREIVLWHYNKLSGEYELTKDTMLWAFDLIRSLFHVRSIVGDEGMAVYATKDGQTDVVQLQSIRTQPDRSSRVMDERSSFATINALFSKPTPLEFYALKNVVNGRTTRNTQVRKAGVVLSDAGLVFKLRRSIVTKQKRSTPVSDPFSFIEDYRGVLTTDLYHDLTSREQNVDVACKQHSQWRLCPTEVIVNVFNDFLVELLEAEENRRS
ncbi:hypothetical protein BWQ96_09566 [Gracilariopsis chorda]|uniref:Uncharacterized protein n=1 Tax=Gracilariopsis chorda TaxID=448386 RepID=A0A2V3IFB9_9FLOR|nr:hypothetical protein BWQ96_09566 [Gracilariopsis chorda]|eukprot:PXF40733.1 hypothetical protein BWQ96_09566 [Gracilariopsis chorda]